MFVKSYLCICVVMMLVRGNLLCPIIFQVNTERGADWYDYPEITTILQSDNITKIYKNVTQSLLDKQVERLRLECKPYLKIQDIVENITQVLLDKQEERFREYKEHVTQVILDQQENFRYYEDKQEKNFRDHWRLLNNQTKDCQDIRNSSRNPQTVLDDSALPIDCQDIRQLGDAQSGVYTIYPTKDQGVSIYCDMDNGAWTVIQKRIDGSENFTRDCASYRDGFGNADHEYWLGNQYIHLLTSSDHYQLRIDMTDQEGQSKHVIYDNFSISDEASGFMLNINGLHGYSDIKDDLDSHNGSKFSTIDRDQDIVAGRSCAQLYHGGWWYKSCHSVYLNGVFGSTTFCDGLSWYSWTGWTESLTLVEMKIRRFTKDAS